MEVGVGNHDIKHSEARQLLADQIHAVQRTLPATIGGNLLLAVLLAWALSPVTPASGLLPWVTLVALHCGANAWVLYKTRRRPLSPRNATRRASACVRSAGALGLIWAGGILVLWPGGDAALPQRFLLVFLVAGVSSGALHSLSAHLPTFTAFFAPTVAGVAVAALLEGGTTFHAVAGITLIYGLVTWRYAKSLNRTLLEAMAGRRELQALAGRLVEEVQRVEHAQRARSRLLAAASHDLRQPVHALSLAPGLLRGDCKDDPSARRLAHAERSVEALTLQFDALLDLARLDAGVLHADPRPVTLVPLLLQLTETLRPQAEARGLSLRVRAAETEVWTDPLVVERMLRNLLVNAIRYTDHGGVVVALRSNSAGGARVDVVDTGIGIPYDQQAQVFEEFVQAEGAEGRGGMGLGLAIVRGCASLLGHTLTLRSKPGRGTRVTVEMQAAPLAARDEAAHPPAHGGLARPWSQGSAASDATQPLDGLQGRIVGLLEDDADVRAATSEALAGWGATVIAAGDLDALVAALVGQAQTPSVLVVDGRLQVGSGGVRAVQRVCEEYNLDALPTVVVSADLQALQQAEVSGFQALRKPITHGALEYALRRALAA